MFYSDFFSPDEGNLNGTYCSEKKNYVCAKKMWSSPADVCFHIFKQQLICAAVGQVCFMVTTMNTSFLLQVTAINASAFMLPLLVIFLFFSRFIFFNTTVEKQLFRFHGDSIVIIPQQDCRTLMSLILFVLFRVSYFCELEWARNTQLAPLTGNDAQLHPHKYVPAKWWCCN